MTAEMAASRLSLRMNPIRLIFSSSLWRAAGFLIVYLLLDWVLFSAAFTAVTTVAVLSFTLIGIPLAIGAAGVVRWCASMERTRLRPLFEQPVPANYNALPEGGLIARARAQWRDRRTWNEFGYLVGLFVPLLALDTIVVGIWGWFLSWITLPLWYWAPWVDYHGHRFHGYQLGFYFPHGPRGPNGPGTVGVFIDTLPKAMIVAALGLVGFALFSYVIVATARMHARVARALLRPPADPLEDIKAVIDAPGPLGSLTKITR